MRLAVAISLLTVIPQLSCCSDWPQFRGPDGQGLALDAPIPVKWDEADNVRWSTDIPGTGWSSPVVQGNRVWITTAVETKPTPEQIAKQQKESRLTPDLFKRRQVAGNVSLRVLCLNRTSGQIIRETEFANVDSPEAIHVGNTYASPTPVINGNHLYVHFGIHGTACLDADTHEVLWKRVIPVFYSVGVGSSPVLYGDLLVLVCDGIDKQFVIALDKATGKDVWKTDRPPKRAEDGQLQKAYSTPLTIHHAGKDQLVVPGAQWVVSYEPLTGKEIWRVDHGDGFSNVPRPVYGDGTVYICTGYGVPQLWAIRVDGNGDVTKTHVSWKVKRQIPRNPSPLLIDNLLFAVSDNGIVSCFDTRNGQAHWQKRIGGNFSASPILASGHVFFFSHEGDVTAFRASSEMSDPMTSHLDGQLMASPAVVDSSVLLRSRAKLYCIK